MKTSAKIIQHPALITISRWILGLTFIFAALCKIYQPLEFVQAIENYQLVSGSIARYISFVLPWVELIAGFLLIIGLFTRVAIRIIVVLLIIFTGTISITLARGLQIDCGCGFNCFTGTLPNDLISVITLVREFFFLFICYPILFFEDRWMSLDHYLKNRS
jgi:putative oxidoreductase